MKRTSLILCVIAMLIALPTLSACEQGETRFSTDYPCQFIFRGDYHRGSALLRTMDNPGLFAIVTSEDRQISVGSGKKSITHLTITLNDGTTKEGIDLTTEIENRYNYRAMGANRALIIGCSNFDGLRAYDRQCRYCLDNSSKTDFPLQWTGNGQAVKCDRCGRVYQLEHGSSTDGYRLHEYRVRFDGTLLNVSNK